MILQNKKNEGFTLIELLIAMTVGVIVFGGIIIIFQKQSDNKLVQDDLAELLQNARVVRMLFEQDLRMAGFTGPNIPAASDQPFYNDNSGIANPPRTGLVNNALTIRYWDDYPTFGGGVRGYKTVDYRLRDGVDQDVLVDDLGWFNSNLAQVADVAENIDALEFLYTINDGTSAVNQIIPNPTANQVPFIRAVTITMLLRGRHERPGYTDMSLYRSPIGTPWGPFDDGFVRKIFTFTFSCRNRELNNG